MLHERKYPRLDTAYYAQLHVPCSITIAVKERKEIFGFAHDAFTKAALEIVRRVGAGLTPQQRSDTRSDPTLLADTRSDPTVQISIPIHIALFMPDHVHLCIEASPSKNIIQFVQEIKSRIAVEAAHQGYPASFWQRSFFDHFLRKEEKLSTVIRYILNNPCRAKLASPWWEYPYWYSNQYTMEQLKNLE